MVDLRNTQGDEFKEFIRDKRVLVADACASSRVGLAKTIADMGAQVSNINLAMNLSSANEGIRKLKPHVVITDYDLGDHCGLDLVHTQREVADDPKTSLFILVTENSSQTAIAQASEEDVDTFVLKPFTAGSLRSSILRAATEKLNPTEYLKTIEEGKRLLTEAKHDEALALFEKAKGLNSKPSLACYYVGQTKIAMKVLDQGRDSYELGLQHNKIHYKCMVGLFEVLMQKQEYGPAYEAVKRISRYYPTHPRRLATALRLAIMTKNYDDIERYFQSFKDLDVSQRDDELVKYICAALVVVGKHYLQSTFITRAMTLFEKAAATASGRPKILREIVVSLTEVGKFQEAASFLVHFPADKKEHPDCVAATFAVADGTQHASLTIEQARGLIGKSVQDPLIYRILIKRLRESGQKDAVTEITQKAAELFPALKAEFAQAN